MEGDSEALVPDVPSSAIQLLYYKKLEWICSKRREYNAILIELMTRKNEIFSSKISELQKENSDLKKDLEIRSEPRRRAEVSSPERSAHRNSAVSLSKYRKRSPQSGRLYLLRKKVKKVKGRVTSKHSKLSSDSEQDSNQRSSLKSSPTKKFCLTISDFMENSNSQFKKVRQDILTVSSPSSEVEEMVTEETVTKEDVAQSQEIPCKLESNDTSASLQEVTPVEKGQAVTPVEKGQAVTPVEKGHPVTPVEKGHPVTPVEKGQAVRSKGKSVKGKKKLKKSFVKTEPRVPLRRSKGISKFDTTVSMLPEVSPKEDSKSLLLKRFKKLQMPKLLS